MKKIRCIIIVITSPIMYWRASEGGLNPKKPPIADIKDVTKKQL